ncbi:hypothetical protein NSPZN2_40804 [Nitrospira defluvii]|uniref:Transposase n=1 Tax=Nitrospira defluvii TaxID=330214 RepID=A0ABN7M2K5_9BACT|nr:hypothetical protein NSPZN2_40804 [Nitrospira defluvii]
MAPSCGAHLNTGELPSQWSSYQGESHDHRPAEVFRKTHVLRLAHLPLLNAPLLGEEGRGLNGIRTAS